MSLKSLDAASAVLEKYMLSSVSIARPGVETVDRVHLTSSVAETTVYTGKAMVSPQGSATRSQEAGTITVLMYEITIPKASADVRINDVITVTADDDTTLVGKKFDVQGTIRSTFSVGIRITAKMREA